MWSHSKPVDNFTKKNLKKKSAWSQSTVDPFYPNHLLEETKGKMFKTNTSVFAKL